ncbi:VTT domain-containing protein [Hymenobacter sp. 15J16-1T3B]|uniref:TVP38/TMEM64 family protein n=1 Tax=Hymenobacter sp. 15J16-1T3B TaxID=2886941 RepID=UPI001D1283C6|nr:VTT domain-containing protein [Hymenobacter sp. 15J16-1T3B]MCC3159144.1 VTT domain-containing protein [Hymenobacter sp. 15J16-1T3B]
MRFLRELLQQNASTLLSLVVLAGLPLVGDSVLTWVLHTNSHWLQHPGAVHMLVYFAVVAVAMALSLTHTTLVTLITGFYFGWPGFGGLVLSYILAAMVGYLIASSLDHGKMLSFLHRFPKAEAVMEELRKQSWQLVLLTRISPVLPFAMITFILAVVKVPRQQFLAASVLGMLPRTLFFYWLGTKANDVFALLSDPDTGTAGKLLVIGLLAGSALGLYWLFNRALQRALKKS